MKIVRTAAATAAACLLLVATPTVSQAHVDRTGDYTVRAGKTIKGDLTVRNGTVRILGTVEGYVNQIGSGSVFVGESGEVQGNLWESGKGSVKIHGTVGGKVEETGKGSVRIYSSGDVTDGVVEFNNGHVRLDDGGQIGGAFERGPGSVKIRGVVDGGVSEYGRGNLLVGKTGRVGISLDENGDGSVKLYGKAGGPTGPLDRVSSIHEYGEGSIRVYATGHFTGAAVIEARAGSVRIDAGARVDGKVSEVHEGDVAVYGHVGEGIRERDEGHVYLFSTATVGADVVERMSGNLYVDEGAVVGGIIDEKGEGSIVYR